MLKHGKWTQAILAAALAVIIATAGAALAKKGGGGKPGGGGEDPPTSELLPGTVFFRVDTQVYGMKTDGAGLFPALPQWYSGVPSDQLYGTEDDPHAGGSPSRTSVPERTLTPLEASTKDLSRNCSPFETLPLHLAA